MIENSILSSIKKLLGIEENYEHFDADITLYINSILSVLNQIGVGTDGFRIADKVAVWGDFLTKDVDLDAVQSYVYLRVRKLFDPPGTSALLESMDKMIAEFEWRGFVAADNAKTHDFAQTDVSTTEEIIW